ncbi:AAA family ATPase, partial [bacterium]|nr:AAA family ATPase [bacterium]
GSNFRSGKHSMEITDEGIKVYPRLEIPPSREEYSLEQISSGMPEVDEMLMGGLERGTVTLISGPTGVGKTSLGLQFIKEAAGRGKRSAVYLFEEDKNLLIKRTQNINIPVKNMIEEGNLIINQIEPLHQTADQFAYHIKREVEENGTEIVLIDSINGYQLSFKGEELQDKIFSLCQYFRKLGVTALVTNEVSRITGDFQVSETGISFTIDNVIFMRYLEMEGQLKKAIGVLKKRISDFERNFREWNITQHGIKVGQPLTELRGILTGNPEWLNSNREES